MSDNSIPVGTTTSTNAADDPYLWLEDVTGDDALTWVGEHNDPTVADLTGSDRFRALQSQALEVLDTDDRIPYVRRRNEFLYNFWRDAAHPRGLWRRTTLESYLTDDPEWDVLVDVDALATAEDENWVWKSATMNYPDYDRALIAMSRGGADAAVVREFDVTTRTWVSDGFVLPEAKSSMSWIDRDTVYVGTDFGPQPDGEGSLTSSGYPRVIKRWSRGQSLDAATTVFAGIVDDVAVSAGYDHTPGFERHFVSRATDFFNELSFEVIEGEPVLVEVPTDSYFSLHHDWMFVRPRSDWEVGGRLRPAGSLLVFDYPDYMAGGRDHQVLFTPDAHTSLQGFSVTRSHLILSTLHDVHTEVTVRILGEWTECRSRICRNCRRCR